MLRLGAEPEKIRVVGDQIGSPNWISELTQAIALADTPAEKARRQRHLPLHQQQCCQLV